MRRKRSEPVNRITVLILVSFLFTGLIIMRLFYLQVIRHDFYQNKAVKAHYGESKLQARRGDIYIKDYASNTPVRVATSVTLDTVFVDPFLIQDKKLNPKIIAERIAPIIFDLEEAKKEDQERMKSEKIKAKTLEEEEKIKPKTDGELYDEFLKNINEKITQVVRPEMKLADRNPTYDLPPETLAEIKKLNLPGIDVIDNTLMAYPPKIADRQKVAEELIRFVDLPPVQIEEDLKGINRYTVLKRKVKPEISAQIKKIIEDDKNSPEKTKNFSAVALEPAYYRYNPEGALASNVLGFVNNDGVGSYGIESAFNTQLQGKNGLFKSQKDGLGKQITVGDTVIEPALDGSEVTLTIDRSIQAFAEKTLARYVKNHRADNGQVIVMDPKTGKIMAMANYPSFDPNNFSDVSEIEEIPLTEEEIARLKPTRNENQFTLEAEAPSAGPTKQIFKEKNTDGTDSYFQFKNIFGPEAYQNKTVLQTYEPGSVFKIITMASAIEDQDVKTTTIVKGYESLYLDENKRGGGTYKGPDGKRYDAKIQNVSPKCTNNGEDMIWIIENSCNTGIAQVAFKMGRNLFYSYVVKFGFGERTEIEFDNEAKGDVGTNYQKWTDSELATRGFGQGLTVTPLQMITAYSAIANKGILMQPYIVENIKARNGKIIETQPTTLGRVISEKTAEIISGMLLNNVEKGDSYGSMRKVITKHHLGAKTGTAQTYKGGKKLEGPGTTITNVLGYGPIEDPQFVILAKMDRPRTGQYADATAAEIYRDMAEFLFDYFNVPPGK
jgi:stage V sporulation protein D (sporulation-specific penicillin-binding protein)